MDSLPVQMSLKIGVNTVSLLVICLFSVLALYEPAMARGPGISGGGDNEPQDINAAWFRRPKADVGSSEKISPIQVCIESATEFPVSKAEAAKDLSAAWLIWKDYMADRSPELGRNLLFDLNINFKCSGARNELQVFLGIESAAIRKEKQRYFNPLSFVSLEEFSPAGRSRGLLYVAGAAVQKTILGTDLSTSHLLRGIFLHEVGHILGAEHIPDTIMRRDIVRFVKSAAGKEEKLRRAMMSSIDWQATVLPKVFGFEYEGSMVSTDCAKLTNEDSRYCQDERQGFFDLVGRKPVGTVRVKLSRLTKAEAYKLQPFHLFVTKLTVTDDISTTVFELLFDGSYGSSRAFESHSSILQRASQSGVVGGWSRTEYGHLINFRGEVVRLILREGGGASAKLQLSYFPIESGYEYMPRSLFQAFPVNGGILSADFWDVWD